MCAAHFGHRFSTPGSLSALSPAHSAQVIANIVIIIFAMFAMLLHSYRGSIASKYTAVAAALVYLAFMEIFFLSYSSLLEDASAKVRSSLPPPSVRFDMGVAVTLIAPTLGMLYWALNAPVDEHARALR